MDQLSAGEGTTVKALTLHQPWASLIAAGAKRFETRFWCPPSVVICKRIAIHAGKQMIGPEDLLGTPGLPKAIAKFLGRWWMYQVPQGAVVATARVVGGYRVRNVENGFAYCDHGPSRDNFTTMARSLPVDLFGDFSPGRWLWELEDVQPLDPPVPARGRQGLWDWTPPKGGGGYRW